MNQAMNMNNTSALVCLSGYRVSDFLERVAWRVGLVRQLVLLHVIDTRPEERIGLAGKRHHRSDKLISEVEERMMNVGTEGAAQILREAADKCLLLGWNEPQLTTLTFMGHPEREIVRAASDRELAVGLVCIGASHSGGAKPKPGPGSVGHVARYVLDHSPCDVLLLR